ncbi:MAG TPA: glycerol-3-phosphate 1-O-acyltransferase PlsY [Xanthobacteraceae bacterium]|nr:glycerol-3-phosphate 1-O-acyltransferase PlsY [Xanthobacteraceae bacterium]
MLQPANSSSALALYVAALAFGYLLGSIPFGMILTRVAGTADIRTIGSGNIGATNVLRTGRRDLAAATLIGDMLKGAVAVLVTHGLFDLDHALIAGLGAFLGHLFPIWLGFRGGKGVATYLGILIGVAAIDASGLPPLAFAGVWLAVAAVTRYSSLAALIACTVTPAVLWITGHHREAELFAVLTVLIFIMHGANIVRLINRTEGRIGGAKS